MIDATDFQTCVPPNQDYRILAFDRCTKNYEFISKDVRRDKFQEENENGTKTTYWRYRCFTAFAFPFATLYPSFSSHDFSLAKQWATEESIKEMPIPELWKPGPMDAMTPAYKAIKRRKKSFEESFPKQIPNAAVGHMFTSDYYKCLCEEVEAAESYTSTARGRKPVQYHI